MTIKKTVTSKVIAANRRNAQLSTGPDHTEAVRSNAVKHGLLARRVRFKSADEESEFRKLASELEREYNPRTATELMLLDEIAISIWKLGIANDCEFAEFANRGTAARAIAQAFASNDLAHPLVSDNGSESGAHLGWDCDQMVIRRGSSGADSEDDMEREASVRQAHVGVVVTLKNSTETILRYQAAIKRDLYRAIATLRGMKREQE